jgi:hypothetical protein
MTGSETDRSPAPKDKDYDIIWFTEVCLSNTLRLETYIQDAEREGDTELARSSARRRPRAVRAPDKVSSCCTSGS